MRTGITVLWGLALPLLLLAMAGCSSSAAPTPSPVSSNVEADATNSPPATPTAVASRAPTPTLPQLRTATAPPSASAVPDSQPSDGVQRLLDAVFEEDMAEVARMMADTGDVSFIPVLVELLRLPLYRDVSRAVSASLVRLIGLPQEAVVGGEGEGQSWAEWLGLHPEMRPPAGFAAWKGRLFSNIDRRIGAFFYEGVKTRIRIEEIVWGGVNKDGIPDLTNPFTVTVVEATYLKPDDRVFGVSINGEHRAYPHRILNAHEMANDSVGGVPIALAY